MCGKMAQLYFLPSKGIGCGAAIADLKDARDHAARVVRSLVLANYPRDWRG